MDMFFFYREKRCRVIVNTLVIECLLLSFTELIHQNTLTMSEAQYDVLKNIMGTQAPSFPQPVRLYGVYSKTRKQRRMVTWMYLDEYGSFMRESYDDVNMSPYVPKK